MGAISSPAVKRVPELDREREVSSRQPGSRIFGQSVDIRRKVAPVGQRTRMTMPDFMKGSTVKIHGQLNMRFRPSCVATERPGRSAAGQSVQASGTWTEPPGLTKQYASRSMILSLCGVDRRLPEDVESQVPLGTSQVWCCLVWKARDDGRCPVKPSREGPKSCIIAGRKWIWAIGKRWVSSPEAVRLLRGPAAGADQACQFLTFTLDHHFAHTR